MSMEGPTATATALGSRSPSAVHSDTTESTVPKKKRKRWSPSLELSFSSAYHSNPFNLKNSWLDSFDKKTDPDERFDGFASPWDVINRIHLEAESEWSLDKRRAYGATGEFEYRYFARNRQTNHVRISLSSFYKIKKHSKTMLGVFWLPYAFRKNYRLPEERKKIYRPAYYRAFVVFARHEHRLARSWQVKVSVDYAQRRFEGPFENRNQDALAAGVHIEKTLSKTVSFALGSEAGMVRTPDGLENGVPVDRSFNAIRTNLEIHLKLGRWKAKTSGAVTYRDYTASDVQNLSYFGRKDTQWAFKTKWSWEVSRRYTVLLEGGYNNTQSGRLSEDPDPDVVPYTKFWFGTGLSFNF